MRTWGGGELVRDKWIGSGRDGLGDVRERKEVKTEG